MQHERRYRPSPFPYSLLWAEPYRERQMRKDGRIMVKLKRSVIKEEELVELTGNYIDAVLLNQFIYWSERVHDFDLFIEQENKRVISQLNNPQLIELTHG